MPSNLNALIRYKTINSCLYGGRRKWSIKELAEACSNALAESRGRYVPISERTIRDDIRILRSDILGFNAPIQQEGGLYFYSEPRYSFMSINITDSELVRKIVKLLYSIRKEINHPELEMILEQLRDKAPEYLLEIIRMEKDYERPEFSLRSETLFKNIPDEIMAEPKATYFAASEPIRWKDLYRFMHIGDLRYTNKKASTTQDKISHIKL